MPILLHSDYSPDVLSVQLVASSVGVTVATDNSALGNTQNIGDSSGETGTDLPFVNLGTNASVDKIVMGDKHSCALFTNGSVKCWGESSVLGLGYSTSDGGFGDGYLETGDTLPFLQFPTGRHATMIESW